MYKVNVLIDGKTQIALAREYFFSSQTQKKILSNDMSENMSVVSFSIKNSLDTRVDSRLMVSGIDLKFISYTEIFLSL